MAEGVDLREPGAVRPASSRLVAVLLGVVVTFLWATTVILVRLGLTEEPVDPIGFAGVRFALAAILLLPFALRRMRAAPAWHGSRAWLTRVVVYGLLQFFIAQVFFYFALTELRATTVGLFMGLAPAVTALVVLRSAHERAGLLQVGGIVILIAGVAIYYGLQLPESGAMAATLAAVAIPVIIGAAVMLGRLAAVDSHRLGGPLALTAVAMVTGAAATLALAFVIEGVPSFSLKVWLLILWLAVVNTALAYTLWAQSQRTLRAVESSVLGDLTVPFVALLGWVVLDEALGIAQIVGIALALTGVVIVQVAPTLRRRSAT
jgi:drug/metabolite transporter (DMT)-like permease